MIVALLFALSLHEVGHAYAAKRNGDLTAHSMGRITLNPLKHLDPVGTLMMVFVGFGWAKPVPVNPNNFEDRKKGMLQVSLGGVAVNFVLIILSLGLLLLTAQIGFSTGTLTNSPETFGSILTMLFFNIFLYSILLNAILMAFNLLPLYPLDGFRVVQTYARPNNRYVLFMERHGLKILFGILLTGAVARILADAAWEGFRFFDILGLYINAVATGIMRMVDAIWGAVFGV